MVHRQLVAVFRFGGTTSLFIDTLTCRETPAGLTTRPSNPVTVPKDIEPTLVRMGDRFERGDIGNLDLTDIGYRDEPRFGEERQNATYHLDR